MSADIPLYLWESFIAVIEEKTLQRAADKLNTTQPTITRHLHQLEEALPLNLFELRGRAKSPTPFAQELYQKINRRLQFLPEDIRQSLQTFGKGEHASLTISGPLEILRRFFSDINFKGKLKLTSSTAENLRTVLKEARQDIVVGNELLETNNYIGKKIFQDDLMLIVPKKFNKGAKDLNDWKKKASTYPLSIYSEDTPIYKDFRATTSIDFEIPDWKALEERVQANLSWSIIPASYVRPNANYLAKPYSTKNQKNQSDIYLYYRKDLSRQPWFKDFLSAIIAKSKI